MSPKGRRNEAINPKINIIVLNAAQIRPRRDSFLVGVIPFLNNVEIEKNIT
jgi:hypothetical protein